MAQRFTLCLLQVFFCLALKGVVLKRLKAIWNLAERSCVRKTMHTALAPFDEQMVTKYTTHTPRTTNTRSTAHATSTRREQGPHKQLMCFVVCQGSAWNLFFFHLSFSLSLASLKKLEGLHQTAAVRETTETNNFFTQNLT